MKLKTFLDGYLHVFLQKFFVILHGLNLQVKIIQIKKKIVQMHRCLEQFYLISVKSLKIEHLIIILQ